MTLEQAEIAVNARRNGVWDAPELVAFGELSPNREADVERISSTYQDVPMPEPETVSSTRITYRGNVYWIEADENGVALCGSHHPLDHNPTGQGDGSNILRVSEHGLERFGSPDGSLCGCHEEYGDIRILDITDETT